MPINAKDCKCDDCGKKAVAFWPVVDPDIPSYPYCRKCVDERKHKLMMELFKIGEKHSHKNEETKNE